MRALLAFILVGALGGTALAQGGPGYYGGPPPPPPPGVFRSGLVLGFDIGLGAINFSNCDGCEALGGLGWGLQLGGMISPNMAIVGDVSAVSHFLDDQQQTLNSVTVTGVLRGWLSRIFFLEGGLGIGWMQLDDPYGTIADTKGGLALLGGAGIEVVQAANFALDIRLRITGARYDYGDGVGVSNVAVLAGFTWY